MAQVRERASECVFVCLCIASDRLRTDKEARSAEGMTPLLLAAGNGRAQVLERLLQAGCDVHALAPGGRTALHLAMGDGDAATVRLLLAAWPEALFIIT